jgi:hypothetical protein
VEEGRAEDEHERSLHSHLDVKFLQGESVLKKIGALRRVFCFLGPRAQGPKTGRRGATHREIHSLPPSRPKVRPVGGEGETPEGLRGGVK